VNRDGTSRHRAPLVIDLNSGYYLSVWRPHRLTPSQGNNSSARADWNRPGTFVLQALCGYAAARVLEPLLDGRFWDYESLAQAD
jgi:hypothetical protein